MGKTEKLGILFSGFWMVISIPLSNDFFERNFDGALMRLFTIVLVASPVIVFHAVRWVFGVTKVPRWLIFSVAAAYLALAAFFFATEIYDDHLLLIFILCALAFSVLSTTHYGRSLLQADPIKNSMHRRSVVEKSNHNQSSGASVPSPFTDLPNPEEVKKIAYDLFVLALYGMSEMNDSLRRASPQSPLPNLIIHDADALRISYALIALNMNRFGFSDGGKKFILAFSMMRSRLITVLLKLIQPKFDGMPLLSESDIETNKPLRESGAKMFDLLDANAKGALLNMHRNLNVPLAPILESAKPYVGKEASVTDIVLTVGQDVDSLNFYVESNLRSLLKKYGHLDSGKRKT